jgi:phosphoenolpyruvate synthase/pyruvate phosphate dikinase
MCGASPYAERSYKWRQRYLHNPEQVFPSILIMPGVNADKSGVLITKGVTSGNNADLTVAFNRGVGGAVDGQASESWLISENDKSHLIAPARELTFLSIPETGGSKRLQTNIESRILTDENLDDLRSFAISMKEKLEVLKNSNMRGPFDIELAFKDKKIWLFQIRPYVENKQAATSEYLEMISPSFEQKKLIALTSKI